MQRKTKSNSSNSNSNPSRTQSSSKSGKTTQQTHLLSLSFNNYTKTDATKRNFFGLFVFAVTFIVYVLTLYPSVVGGDSGELVVASNQLGVAHPPGYPLFVLLGFSFDKVLSPFFGPVAYRLNLMSALFGAFASLCIFLVVTLWTTDILSALVSSFFFAFSPLVWLYTTQAEVFALNNALVCALLYISVVYAKSKDENNTSRSVTLAHVGAFVCGLGMANQHTIVFLIIPIVVWVTLIVGKNELLNFQRAKTLTLATLLGLSPYIHMFLAPSFYPTRFSWGDSGTINGFVHHFLRADYGTFKLYSGKDADQSGYFNRLVFFFETFTTETLYIGVAFALIGFYSCVRSGSKSSLGILFVVTFLLYITLFLWLTNLPLQDALFQGILQRFFMQPNAICCVFLGLGIAHIHQYTKKIGFSKFFVFVVLVLSSLQLGKNYAKQDQHLNYTFHQYGHWILDPLPKNSILLVAGDLQAHVTHYHQICEGLKKDVDILSIDAMAYTWFKKQHKLYPNVTFPADFYGVAPKKNFRNYNLKQFLDANLIERNRQVYVIGNLKRDDESVYESYLTLPFGLGVRIFPKNEMPDVWDWLTVMESVLPPTNATLPEKAKYGPDSWEQIAKTNYFQSWEAMANIFVHTGAKTNRLDSEKALLKAASLLEHVRERHLSRYTLKNLGVVYDYLRAIYSQKELNSQSDIFFQKTVSAWSDLVDLLPIDYNDKDMPSIVKFVSLNRKKY